ncbi:2OG-FeII_Oxy_2 domain-containing protein [Pseudozyma hubeiensis]|nr:2OG-FeII_Oxy_2 domain-containing protein [Pseudozyma hubeiensis]
MTSGPIIWSETRQELCESLPYYRAYQTGCYVTSSHHSTKTLSTASHPSFILLKDSVPHGYLLAGFPSRRDAWSSNGRVIISHGGGKSQVIPHDGDDAAAHSASQPKASLRQDQSASDSIIRALLHSARHRLPIVLIAGEGYALLPWKLACGYAVLGWYVITDAWAEREASGGGEDAGYVRWKFRFEWIPAQGEPWWELEPEDAGKVWDPRLRVETFTKAQRRLSRKMRGKMADGRSRASTMYRSDSSSSEANHTKAGHVSDDEREHLLFGPLNPAPRLISTVTVTPHSKTPCSLINSASCRICRSPSPAVFSDWMCLQPTCLAFFLLSTGTPPDEHSLSFSPDFLRPLGASLDSTFPSNQPPFPLVPERPSSTSMDQSRGLWCKKCGRLSCLSIERKRSSSPTTSQSVPTQPCETISNPQPPSAIPFRGHVLKNHAGGGRMLTQQFTCNYGVAYKHVVAMGTQPLSPTLSPPPILSTLSLLHTRTRSAVPSLEQDFNELYPVLYLEHQKMSFHDDGEPGLGPIVSSLSLGSTCRMKFRIKQKFSSDFPEVSNRTVLDLPLRHGSVVVQQGKDLQRMLEHCVNPDGFRIAVTARRIDPVANGGPVKRERQEKDGGVGRDGSVSRPVKRRKETPTSNRDKQTSRSISSASRANLMNPLQSPPPSRPSTHHYPPSSDALNSSGRNAHHTPSSIPDTAPIQS